MFRPENFSRRTPAGFRVTLICCAGLSLMKCNEKHRFAGEFSHVYESYVDGQPLYLGLMACIYTTIASAFGIKCVCSALLGQIPTV